MQQTVTIIIPIYKAQPSETELASFKQCIKILGSYPICIVTHSEVDIDIYLNTAKQHPIIIKYFHSHYFSSIDGYSELMREQIFYKAFRKYDYMLIYQLDAWVFKDELELWCKKGYDYIGAPWFTNFGSHEEGKELWTVGNGGLSLRKTKRFVELTNPNRIMMLPNEIFEREYKGIKSLFRCILRVFGRRNTVNYFKDLYYDTPEDHYFCIKLLYYGNMKLHIPHPEEAMYFSFERSPRYLYNRTDGKLPFGCHAWEKYDKLFWNDFIQS